MTTRILPLTLTLTCASLLLTACPTGSTDEGADTFTSTDDVGTTGDTTAETTAETGTSTSETDTAETTTDTGTESTSDTGTDTGTETDTGMAPGECAQPDPGFGAAITQGAKVAHAELIGTDEVHFNLCEMEGKPLVMEVGAVWCGPCQSYGKALAQDLETTFAEIDVARVRAVGDGRLAIHNGERDRVL